MTGVGDQSPSLSQSLAQDMPAMMTQSMCIPSGTPVTPAPDIMTSSTSSLQGLRKGSGLRNQTSQNWFTFDDPADSTEGRAESAAREKEREERVRRLREQQEEERKRKLEELKLHAQQAAKFREQQEEERRRHIDSRRSNDMDRRQQVEERRRDIERSEQERREAILAKNKEREGRLDRERRSSRGNIEFAFGSSAPRLIEPRVDSASGYWGSRRSTSSNNVGAPSTCHQPNPQDGRRSQERETGLTDLRNKRTASAQGLDRSSEGEENGLVTPQVVQGAHRRRTDLVPTIVMKREEGGYGGREGATPRRSPGRQARAVSMSRLEQLARPRTCAQRPQHDEGGVVRGVQGAQSMQHLPPNRPTGQAVGGDRKLTNRARARTVHTTPSSKDSGGFKKPEGLSRENSSSSRPGSALSAGGRGSGGVRLRNSGGGAARRQRPLSIATTGMTASMYEERQKPPTNHQPRPKTGTPKPDRMKRARSVTSDTAIDDDNRSTTSSQGGSTRTPSRRTPSQVKAEAAARKAKGAHSVQSTGRPQVSTPKSSLGAKRETGQGKNNDSKSKSPSPAVSQGQIETTGGAEAGGRQCTPDILKDNTKKPSEPPKETEDVVNVDTDAGVADSDTAPASEFVPNDQEKEEKGEQEQKEKEKSPGSEEENQPNNEEVKEKKIITSEEEAKARIAEKRREMKEQKEREAEAERLRLEEEQRKEEEQRRREEEEMRQMERLAEEGRRAEEERIQRAIQEREEEERRQREEEEQQRREKEDTEKKTKEEAEKREAELQEKLKKEEEERLARKKRIEEIMARTRGKGGSSSSPSPAPQPAPAPAPVPTPAAEAAPPAPAPSLSRQEGSSDLTQQPASLDPLGDPTKPDLLGDISDKVEAENARNLSQRGPSPSPPSPSEPEVEKGALDSLSLKSEDTENSSPLITLENGVHNKKSNGVMDGSAFDQILDLGDMGDSNKDEKSQGVPSPIRAFEENSQQNNTGALGVRDLLS